MQKAKFSDGRHGKQVAEKECYHAYVVLQTTSRSWRDANVDGKMKSKEEAKGIGLTENQIFVVGKFVSEYEYLAVRVNAS
jgi:hypothetical protein